MAKNYLTLTYFSLWLNALRFMLSSVFFHLLILGMSMLLIDQIEDVWHVTGE